MSNEQNWAFEKDRLLECFPDELTNPLTPAKARHIIDRAIVCIKACEGIPTDDFNNQQLVKCPGCKSIFLIDPSEDFYQHAPGVTSGCDLCHGVSVRGLLEANGIKWEGRDIRGGT